MSPPPASRTERRRGRLIVDGRVLVDDHFSGIGHYTMSLLQAVDRQIADTGLDGRIAVPFTHLGRLRRFEFQTLRPLALPFSYRSFRSRVERGRLPPMDPIAGRGVYFFPNYNRWPLLRARSITAVHDLSFVKLPETVDAPNARYLRRVVGDAVRHSDLLTALTQTMAAEIGDEYGLPDDRIRVIGCGVDRRHFYRRSRSEIRRVTRRLGIFGDYVLSVGNIEPRKNQVRLVEAFKDLPTEIRDRHTLVLVGAGAWNQERIHRAVDEALDDGCRIRLLLGAVGDDDLPALYSGAVGSAYVSRYEGFGMPVVESAACGTPVLVSNRSVLPEVAGDAGIFVDPDDTADLTRGLRALLTLTPEGRADYVTLGFENLRRHRWEDVAAALLTAVQEVRER